MSVVAAEEVLSFVIRQIEDDLAAVGLDPHDVTEDLDLIDSGVLDSIRFIELVTAIEDRFGIEADFEEIDPLELAVLGVFCRHIEQLSAGESR